MRINKMRRCKEIINDPEVPDYIKFKAEVLLLFEKYDPFNPETTITPEQFFGTLWFEMMNMHHMMSLALDHFNDVMPPFYKLPEKDAKYWERP